LPRGDLGPAGAVSEGPASGGRQPPELTWTHPIVGRSLGGLTPPARRATAIPTTHPTGRGEALAPAE